MIIWLFSVPQHETNTWLGSSIGPMMTSYLQLRTFFFFRGSGRELLSRLYHGNSARRCNTDGRSVCRREDYVKKERKKATLAQIRPLHHEIFSPPSDKYGSEESFSHVLFHFIFFSPPYFVTFLRIGKANSQPVNDNCTVFCFNPGPIHKDVAITWATWYELAWIYCQLKTRKALLQIKDVTLRTRRALSPYNWYSNSALLVLNGTSFNCNNALLALKLRYNIGLLPKSRIHAR